MIQREGDRTAIIPIGRIDANSSQRFADEINEALPGTRELVLDFSQLDYISSYGRKVVLQAIKTMAGRGEFRIIGGRPAIYEILEFAGFLGMCDVEKQG